jgi:hypothetical protein
MSDKRNTATVVFVISFIIALCLVVTGVVMAMTADGHSREAILLIMAGLLVSLAYRIIGLYEVHRSMRISMADKLFWTVGFILVGSVTGLLYFFSGRKRVLG